jgi:hypothetical protein
VRERGRIRDPDQAGGGESGHDDTQRSSGTPSTTQGPVGVAPDVGPAPDSIA